MTLIPAHSEQIYRDLLYHRDLSVASKGRIAEYDYMARRRRTTITITTKQDEKKREE